MKLVILFFWMINGAYAQAQSTERPSTSVGKELRSSKPKNSTDLISYFTSSPPRDKLLGIMLKRWLENLHFNNKRIDDSLSIAAYNEFIERLDFGKRFFLREDIVALDKHKREMDDQMIAGQLVLLGESTTLLRKRIEEVRVMVMGLLKKPFDLKVKEKHETDPEKRKFAKTKEELKSLWRKTLKLDILNNYFEILSDDEDEKDKKKVSKKKKLTYTQLEEKAREKTAKSYKRVFKRMLQEDHNDELNKFFNSITNIFDPHTVYFPPREKEDFDINMSGKLEGIGAILREDGDYIKVVEIIPGSASWRGKILKPEDSILKVAQGKEEPMDIVGMRVEDAVQLIRGPKGSEVRLTVKHSNGQIVVIPIIRDVVVIEEQYVKHSVIQLEGGKKKYGYIFVPSFYRDFNRNIFDKTARNCTDDVRKSLEALKKKNVDGIVLDLRNNGGGSLFDSRLMTGLFIKKGPVVQVKDSQGTVEILKDTDSQVVYSGPLVVMVNKFSASASEILAGALQDYGRAVIVGGEHTHGKGTVQTVLDLDDQLRSGITLDKPLGSLKLTIQKFYRINGSSTQYKGVTPDIILPDPLGYIESGERKQEYSLKWDEINSVDFEKWPQTIKVSQIQNKSNARVRNNKKFKRIEELVKLLKKRRDQTKISLYLEDYNSRRESNKKEAEGLKFEDEKSKVIITETSLKNPRSEDQKKRADEWVKTLKTDPFIEETINILGDMSSVSVAKLK